MRKIWPFTFNVLLFAGVAFVLPFVVLYYQSVGFTGTQIGLLTGISPLITLFGALMWTSLADKTQRHRLIMSLVILFATMTLFVFPTLRAFVPVLVCAILFNAFFAPVSSFADSATMFMLAHEKEMYGRVRLGGTIGFGLAATVAGALVQNYGLRLAFWGSAALLLLAFFVSQNLVYSPLKDGDSSGGGVRAMLMSPRWRLFLLVAFAGGLSFSNTNNYLFPYMKELGASELTMGLALTIGTISEIPVFFFGHLLMQRFKPHGLLMLAMVITGVRLFLLAISSTPNQILLGQLLNGMTFPAMWMAGVAYAHENAPKGMTATAQGMFSAMVMGFGAAVGGFVGGLLLEDMGGSGLYLVLGITVSIIMTFVALIYNRLPALPPVETQ